MSDLSSDCPDRTGREWYPYRQKISRKRTESSRRGHHEMTARAYKERGTAEGIDESMFVFSVVLSVINLFLWTQRNMKHSQKGKRRSAVHPDLNPIENVVELKL
ncbi:hypothetical protein TNCV_2968631 [Trichonephila clavipes]|nr:hypothetical protein TNCV_2968631 [Trichonephila clavipes]